MNDSVMRVSVLNILLPMVLLVACAACGNRPSGVLSEDKMVKLMVDMEIAEAYASQQSNSTDYKLELGQRVLAAHGISNEELDSTLAWYGRNLDEYSALFEKVDKEIAKRRIKYSDNPNESSASLANLWPYSVHQVVSPLSGSEALAFSLHNPKINHGDVVNFSFFMANRGSGKGVLGVEYADGTGESVVNNFNGKNKLEISLQSDTAKTVTRLYGYTLFKDLDKKPVYIDSIYITLQPIDSADFQSKRRSQKGYGFLYNRKPVIKEEKPDTIPTDTVATDSTVLKEPPAVKPEVRPEPVKIKPATLNS